PAASSPSSDDAMPWDMDGPQDRTTLTGRGVPKQAPPAEPPAAASVLMSDMDFAAIPQDDFEPIPDTTGIERAQEIITQAGKLDSMAVGLADLLVGLLEYRDPFFRGGTSQTRLLATAIAKEMGFNAEEMQAVALGTVLRDLGQVPLKGLISKPGSELGAEGRRRVESHVETALELLASVDLPPMVRDVIRHHHERYDGGGYPDGLVGESIPLAARIVAVADSFAAMISARPHRLPRRVPAAIEDIKGNAGKQFDPAVVAVLSRVLQGSDWRGLRFGLRHHLLIVDPDDSRAMVLATKLCSHGYLAEAAFDLETASDRFKRSKLAAIIVSAELAEGDLDKLVREVRETVRVAMLPVIVTDAGVSTRVALLEAGADVCLARGSSFEELKATVEAFLRREGKSAPMQAKTGDAAPWSGLQGDIEDFPLGWLLQVLNYDARTAAIFLTTDGDDGVIYVQGGNPRHAQTKRLAGEDAFRAMLKWEKGSFTVDPDGKSEDHTIKVPLMNLLLDQAVQDDHAAFFGSVQS
ncbi:MAG TPA: HD domain-containing phosphohydrolase, partial [Hyphomicrobiaceae bacterium]